MGLQIIGGLQTTKARDAVRLADVIEVVDRARLADAIAEAIQKEGRSPDLLVQVNVGDEPQKSGIPTAEPERFNEACRVRFGPSMHGLVCTSRLYTIHPAHDYTGDYNQCARLAPLISQQTY